MSSYIYNFIGINIKIDFNLWNFIESWRNFIKFKSVNNIIVFGYGKFICKYLNSDIWLVVIECCEYLGGCCWNFGIVVYDFVYEFFCCFNV